MLMSRKSLIRQARQLYADEDLGLELDQTVFAFDSTAIDPCLSLFPWAPFQRSKAAVKIHTLLDPRGSIPNLIHVNSAHVGDVSVLDEFAPLPGACYVMDRGYIHFARLYRLTTAAAYFVVRARKNRQYRRRYSHRVDKATALRSDQTIVLTGHDSAHDYPAEARKKPRAKQSRIATRCGHSRIVLCRQTNFFKRSWH